MTKQQQVKDYLILLALVFSGAAALGYELLWTRLLGLALGGEVIGMLGVLAGFFGGMVLGAMVLSKHASRVANPLRVFVILEICTSVYGVLSPWLIYGLSASMPRWLGPVAGDNSSFLALLVTVLIAGVVLLPATFCIGANFAYLVEARRRVFKKDKKDKNLGRVYAANTFGATLGVGSAVYFIMPWLGLAWSGVFYALIGMLGVGAALLWQKSMGGATLKPKYKKAVQEASVPLNFSYLLLFGTGLAAIGLEIVVVHLLKQIFQNTIFTFANILAVYLLGTALGAWLYQWRLRKLTYNIAAMLFSGMLISLVVLVLMLQNGGRILEGLSPESTQFQWHLFAEIALSSMVFLMPTLFMGALFSHLMSWVPTKAVGSAYAVNTLGSTFSPFVFGLFLIPKFSPFFAMAMVGLIYLGLFVSCIIKLKWPKTWLIPGLSAVLLMTLFGWAGLDLITVDKSLKVLDRKEGLMGTVIVTEEPQRAGPFGLPMRTLQINNHFRMGGGVSFLERRMGNLPLLLADQPEKVLFLGIGTGTTLGVIKEYPLKEVEAVEIVPEVKKVLPWFEEHNQKVLQDDRLQYHTADARRFVVASRDQFDVIIADLFHPARDGAGLLYTREHFQAIKNHLNPNGIFAQWIPLHQFDLNNLKTLIRTFQHVFPNVHAFLGGYNAQYPVIVLLGLEEEFTIDISAVNQTILSSTGVQMAFENGQDILGSYVLGAEALSNFGGNGALNTDLNPRILFDAPKSVYTSELSRAQTNIAALIQLREPLPESLIDTHGDETLLLESIELNWIAIGHFLEGNRLLVKEEMTQALRKYIDAYLANPDFSPARGKVFQAAMDDAIPLANLKTILNERDFERLQAIRQGR